jgi:hypothetical protein
MKIRGNADIWRSGNDVSVKSAIIPPINKERPAPAVVDSNLENLLTVDMDRDCLIQLPSKIKEVVEDLAEQEKRLENKLWVVVRSVNTDKGIKGFRLNPSDIIRFGKVKFKIKNTKTLNANNPKSPNLTMIKNLTAIKEEINNNTTDRRTNNMSTNINNSTTINLSATQDPGITQDTTLVQKMVEEPICCRICLGDDCNEPDNPLISPCKCTGTMRYVHLECFKNWIKKQVLIKSSTNLISYYWKKLQCELCQDIINHELTNYEAKLQLVDLPSVEEPHIILESYMNDKSKGFHIIKFSENKSSIKLGRGFNCDIRINDISVSRLHAIIKLEKGNFYLQDSASKFGTLILLQEKTLPFSLFKDVSLQIGRSVLEFKFTLKSSGFFSTKKRKKSSALNTTHLDVIEPSHVIEPSRVPEVKEDLEDHKESSNDITMKNDHDKTHIIETHAPLETIHNTNTNVVTEDHNHERTNMIVVVRSESRNQGSQEIQPVEPPVVASHEMAGFSLRSSPVNLELETSRVTVHNIE